MEGEGVIEREVGGSDREGKREEVIERGWGESHREGRGSDSSSEEWEEEYCRGEGDGVIERGGRGSYRKVD